MSFLGRQDYLCQETLLCPEQSSGVFCSYSRPSTPITTRTNSSAKYDSSPRARSNTYHSNCCIEDKDCSLALSNGDRPFSSMEIRPRSSSTMENRSDMARCPARHGTSNRSSHKQSRRSSTNRNPKFDTIHSGIIETEYGENVNMLHPFLPTHSQTLYNNSELVLNKRRKCCKMSCIFDPAGLLCHYWTGIVAGAFVYNLWVIIYRFSISEICADTVIIWFSLDYFADIVYLVDLIMGFRTGFLDDNGVLQINKNRMHNHYVNSTAFYLDCLCLLPLDLLYLSLGFTSLLRLTRLAKFYKFLQFVDTRERHTSWPNTLRFAVLLHTILLIIHWNACLMYKMKGHLHFTIFDSTYYAGLLRVKKEEVLPGTVQTIFPESTFNETWPWMFNDDLHNYILAFYCSLQGLCLLSLPVPKIEPTSGICKLGLIYSTIQLLMSLLLFAAILGYVSGIVASSGASRKIFQAELDKVKSFMKTNSVPEYLQSKVIRWYDHLWATKNASSAFANTMECLPENLRAEVSLHVHLDTLKRVEIFQNTEPGFLRELVVYLKPMLFSPRDYVCKKGEIGKEMYIVKTGKLHVLADNENTVLATLKPGSYFGEIAILNMGSVGNRRTASVISVGYSDVFVLQKRDIWNLLDDYPAARMRMELIARRRLEQKREQAKKERAELEKKYQLKDTDAISVNSAPGCIENSNADLHTLRGNMLEIPKIILPESDSEISNSPSGSVDRSTCSRKSSGTEKQKSPLNGHCLMTKPLSDIMGNRESII